MEQNQIKIQNPYNIVIQDEDVPILEIFGQDPNNIWFSNRFIYQDTKFTVKIKQKLIKLFVNLETYLNHAPKQERYALCDRNRNCETELIETLSECICCPKNSRLSYVRKLSYKINGFQTLIEMFRLKQYFRCKHSRMNVFTEVEGIRRAFAIEAPLAEIGNMIGGWIKYIHANNTTASNLIPTDTNEIIPLLNNDR